MISFCLTLLKLHYQHYFPILLESISNYCPLVDEIIICKNEEEKFYKEEFSYRGKDVRIYGREYDKPTKNRVHETFTTESYLGSINHALSMHQCIDKTKNEYIFLCDPDIFFCNVIDTFYMDLINKYKLHIVGSPYMNANNPCVKRFVQGDFPIHQCCLLKKSDLPPKTWLNGLLKVFGVEYPGKYLIPIPPPSSGNETTLPEEILQKFPNPEGHLDTSCLLYIWAMESKWNWLSFLPEDGHYYHSKYYRGNVKIREKTMKLFYHQCDSSHGAYGNGINFTNTYNEFLKSIS